MSAAPCMARAARLPRGQYCHNRFHFLAGGRWHRVPVCWRPTRASSSYCARCFNEVEKGKLHRGGEGGKGRRRAVSRDPDALSLALARPLQGATAQCCDRRPKIGSALQPTQFFTRRGCSAHAQPTRAVAYPRGLPAHGSAVRASRGEGREAHGVGGRGVRGGGVPSASAGGSRDRDERSRHAEGRLKPRTQHAAADYWI